MIEKAKNCRVRRSKDEVKACKERLSDSHLKWYHKRELMRKKFLKMKQAKFFAAFLAVILAPFPIFAQLKPAAPTDALLGIFPVSELREGMRGAARTVFRGSVSEEFNVEILGVIPNAIGPKQDMIVGRLSGTNAERTSVFAGMSGSPVYIDGRLVGAISYSFPFAKEPICGITPFEQMSSVMEQAPAPIFGAARQKAFSYAELLSDTWQPNFYDAGGSNRPAASGFGSNSRLMAVAGQSFVPISTPVTFSGISQQTLDMFAPGLIRAGLMPVAAAGGDSGLKPMKPANEKTLLGGDSVVVHLARGDVQIAAAGTVTLRDGEKIYAFGHPFISLGSTDLPMSESHVVTVVPNANNSFKLAVADSPVGAMTQDRATGIYGRLGQAPKMLPVKITLTTSRGRNEEINFESAIDQFLTPLIVSVGVANALQASERGIGETTIELKGEITVKGEEPIVINRRFAGSQSTAFAASAAAIPLGVLLRADFDNTQITGLTINMTAIDGSKTAAIDRISVDKTQVRAGETIELTAFERAESGRIIIKRMPVTIPADTAPGRLTILVGDGSAVQQNTAVTQFVPKTAAQLISTINSLKRPDRLYAVLSRTSTGAIVGSSEMPNLPPSVLATMNNDRSAGGSKPSVQTIVSEVQMPTGEYVVSGSQSLTIEVIR